MSPVAYRRLSGGAVARDRLLPRLAFSDPATHSIEIF